MASKFERTTGGMRQEDADFARKLRADAEAKGWAFRGIEAGEGEYELIFKGPRNAPSILSMRVQLSHNSMEDVHLLITADVGRGADKITMQYDSVGLIAPDYEIPAASEARELAITEGEPLSDWD